MEVRKGYKQTEVGVIPEDWEGKQLSDISEFITKGSTPTTYGFKWESDGVLFLRSECVGNNGLDLSQSMFISKTAHKALFRGEIKSGDMLITITGNVGRVVFLNNQFGHGNINQHIAKIRVVDNNTCPLFIYHFLSQNIYRKYFESIVTGQAYPQISLKQVRDAIIYFPPTKSEQTAIATALSDADALISSLEKLIVKKRAIKQGAMQELLRPKEGWEVKSLGEIAEVSTGNTPPTRDLDNYGLDYCFVSPIDLGQIKYIAHTEKKLSKKGFSISRKFPQNSILFTCIGSTIGKMGITCFEMTSNQQINAVFANNSYSTEYLYYYLNFISEQIKSSASEQALPMINKTEFQKVLIQLPSKSEQTRIATILSDMDAEIAGLEEKLSKYKMVKQGMMQELLTGRARLI